MARAVRRTGRRLSALRPLAWRWWLPACALGLLLGQSASHGGVRPVLLTLAAGAASPAVLYLHRALGTAAVLAASAAVVGAEQIRHQESARVARSARLPAGRVALRGVIVQARPHRAPGGRGGASLDVALDVGVDGFGRGEIVRLAVWRSDRAWRTGDRVAWRGSVRPPRGFCNDGEDGYARTAWRRGVVAVASTADERALEVVPWAPAVIDVRAWLAAGRQAIGAALARTVASIGERAVLAALIYGDQSEVPAELRAAYARTGTAHVLSVSGLHIAVVAAAAFGLLRLLLVRCGWLALRTLVVRWAAVGALIPATLYAALSGGAVATLRALVMGALALGAITLLRRADVWTAIAAAAILLALGDPGVAGEASFQLSFAAVTALVAAGTWLARWRAARGGRWADDRRLAGRGLGLVAGALVAALAAGVATAPITAYHFGSFALLGVLANLVVVPLVGSVALLIGLAGTVVLPISSGVAALLFELAALAIAPGNALVVWLAARPGAAVDAGVPSALHVVAWLALAVAILSTGAVRRAAIVTGVVVAATLALQIAYERFAPRVTIRFVDVGQGDATLIRGPQGAATLIDAGGLNGAFDPGERVVTPALRRAAVHELDVMALSHPDHDHHGGLAAVARALRVGEFWSSGQSSPSASFRALGDALVQRAVTQRRVARGTVEALAGGLALEVLHPVAGTATRSRNDGSLVVRATFGATRVLLTGDVETAGESEILRRREPIAATVVKAPHHGSRSSSSRAFVARARPSLVVALLGANNRFGFPAAEVRRRYERLGAAWLQTDRDGEVVIRSDGQLEQVTTCRQR